MFLYCCHLIMKKINSPARIRTEVPGARVPDDWPLHYGADFMSHYLRKYLKSLGDTGTQQLKVLILFLQRSRFPKLSLLKKTSGKECIKILCNKFGFLVKRQTGSHIILRRETPEGVTGTVVPNHKELKIGTLKLI